MSFLVGVRTDFVLGFLSSAGSWILGFVLGKFLDFLGEVGWRAHQEQRKQKQPKPCPKSAKNLQKWSKNLRKSTPDPSKIDAKTVLNDVQKQNRIKNRSWGAAGPFLEAIFSNLELSWPPRWAHVGGQDGPKIDKKIDAQKRWIFEGFLEPPKIGKSLILEANMEASWHQNRSRNRWYLRKAVF